MCMSLNEVYCSMTHMGLDTETVSVGERSGSGL